MSKENDQVTKHTGDTSYDPYGKKEIVWPSRKTRQRKLSSGVKETKLESEVTQYPENSNSANEGQITNTYTDIGLVNTNNGITTVHVEHGAEQSHSHETFYATNVQIEPSEPVPIGDAPPFLQFNSVPVKPFSVLLENTERSSTFVTVNPELSTQISTVKVESHVSTVKEESHSTVKLESHLSTVKSESHVSTVKCETVDSVEDDKSTESAVVDEETDSTTPRMSTDSSVMTSQMILDTNAVPSAMPGVSGGTTSSIRRNKSDRDKKLGHRRVTTGGDVTYKKIQSRQIMGSIQLGVQQAVGGLASKPGRDLLMQDFLTVETTNFLSSGSSYTPAHHFKDFRFKAYAPIAFRYFRELFGIRPDDFLMSMCMYPMTELTNPGASGSIFYLTHDDELIVKTVQHKEGDFLQKLLPGYYMNLDQNPRTLLPKFFGLYCYQCNSKNVRLICMNNLLPSSIRIHQKYDLKGSTYKRKASKSERAKKSPTFKDLDFMEHHEHGLLLEADTYNALMKTIYRDCRVLESFKIMDYSLLIGIHNVDKGKNEKAEQGIDGADSMANLNRSRSINKQRLIAHSTALESIQAESEPVDMEDVPPGGIPARNTKGERLFLFLGVIDILQSYQLKKKLEHTFKSMVHDGDTVSVHRPAFYANRFKEFMGKRVFKKIESLDLPEIKGNHRKFRTLVSSYIALKHSPSKRKGISKMKSEGNDNEVPSYGVSSKEDKTGTSNSGATSPTDSKMLHQTPVSVHSPPAVDDSSSSTNQIPTPPVFPAVLKDRPRAKMPPPVPPRGVRSRERRQEHTGYDFAKGGDKLARNKAAIVSQSDVNRSDSLYTSSFSTGETLSVSDVHLESRSTLSVESGIGSTVRPTPWTPPTSIEGSTPTPTPTWTEGTPSFTESSSSGDLIYPTTPARSLSLNTSRDSEQGTNVSTAEIEFIRCDGEHSYSR